MATYVNFTNRLVTCPYDEAHKVKESRLQLHIAKCKKNHLDVEKKVCPFNATHLLDPSEYEYHLGICLDRAPLDRLLAKKVDDNNPFKGRVAVPSYNEHTPIITGENWDDEISREPAPGYVPQAMPPQGGIVEPPAMAKPSERKKLYQELHRWQEQDDGPEENAKSPELPINVLRQPKSPDEDCQVQKMQKQKVQDFQNLGLGRGRTNSRIAANFSFVNQQQIGNPNYEAVVNGISKLGLGRSQNTVQVAPTLSDDNDFPVLGRGRGVSPILKNAGVNRPGQR